MKLRVFIAVTHLLGAGHLTRAAALARAFMGKGHAVTLVSGGMPSPLTHLPGAEIVQLPPVMTVGTDFRTLLDAHGRPMGEDDLAARRDLLLEAFRAMRPDVVVTELFPFGRRVLAGEFLDLVEAAHGLVPRPVIACSIRDILAAPRKRDRIEEADERLLRFYDLVLVHGDPALVPLEASWPVSERIRPLIRYTGYVDEGGVVLSPESRAGIVVSGGSSAASLPLYRAAISAAERVLHQPWRVLVGPGVGEDVLGEIRSAAPPHVSVERARPDFRNLLAGAAVSVSQAGYNTVVDLLRAAPPAVLVPFEAGHETEQRIRAERLANRGLASVLDEAHLSGPRLAEAIESALTGPSVSHGIALDGSARSVGLIEHQVARAPNVHWRWDWTPLATAIKRARDVGWEPQFWWRDDDAVAETPALHRLLTLAERYRRPLAVAVVPKRAEASLAGVLASSPWTVALVHGLSHANHAPAGAKKAELGPRRPLPILAREAAAGLFTLQEAFRDKALPVLVPPWNRIAPDLVLLLPSLGYTGLSSFRDRDRRAVPGLAWVNTHLDPIDWQGSRSLHSPDALIGLAAAAVDRRLNGLADRDEPIGLLTHHLVHDEPIWTFCDALLEQMAQHGMRFTAARPLFSGDNRIAVGL
jgi:predicted glycosyltransferase